LFDAAKQGAPCERCPSGYFSRGGKLEACTPCPFGYTSAKGATSIHECVAFAQACPVGQIVDPDIAALSADDCHCLPGFGSRERLWALPQTLRARAVAAVPAAWSQLLTCHGDA
jgi:hypothetical protein